MIDHMSINVGDLARGAAFYDAALAVLGFGRAMEIDLPEEGYRAIGYGPATAPEREHADPPFWIGAATGEAAPVTPMEGFHVAFRAESRAAVEAFYAAALAAGGTDNGAPGLRPHYHENYYAAFVIDPDGYHVEVVCHKPEND